jgi:hypothetical protein
VKTAAPTVDNDGNALVAGALYFNSGAVTLDDKGMWVYDGGTWIKASSAQQAALTTYEFVATAGQTTFSGNDANGLALTYIAGGVIVALNGVVLRPGDDFTATNGSSIVLASAAALNDELVAYAFASFDVANTYTQAQIDTALAGKLSTASGAVGTANIADSAVTDAKIASLSASKLTGQLPDANAPSGSVIQVVQTTFGSVASINSLTYVSTGHSLAITPLSASSKILIAYYFCFGQVKSPDAVQDNMKGFSIFRNGSNIAPHNDCFFRHQNETSGNINFDEQTEETSICFLDSPSTTSAVTYDLRAVSDNLGVTIVYNRRGSSSGSLEGSAIAIAMEIAG